MWMCNCLVVVNRNNEDTNSLADIAAALTDMGAAVMVDELHHVIDATLPAHDLPVVNAIPGVSYVRCVFNYLCGQPPRQAA